MEINAYTFKWAIYVESNNKVNFSKSIYGANQKHLEEKLQGKKGKFFIITDKQYGLIQNSWSKDKELKPKNKSTN